MHSFKDKVGREWSLEANFGSYGRVKATTGVKLYDIATENRESLVQLADALTLGQVLWAMVEPQAESRGITPEEFYEAFDGEVVGAAYAALIDEMIFFCHPRQRKVLGMAVKKIREAETKADRIVDNKIEEFEKEIDRAIEQWTHGLSAMNLPEFSASTPADGPSASCSTLSAGDDARSGITPAPSSPNS